MSLLTSDSRIVTVSRTLYNKVKRRQV